jgi:CheY-like chemotaxis protein
MTATSASKCRVLVVEDEALIAMLVEDMLLDLGCEVIATAGRFEEAITVAKTGDFDLALLDVNLAGRPVFPVAQVLVERAIPFAFLTGYGSSGIDPTYPDAPVLAKPFQAQDLEAVVRRLWPNRGGPAGTSPII